MGYFQRHDIPYYHALADAFTICDGYYCSLHGPTNPNRMYLFTGTSGQSMGNFGAQAVTNADDSNWTADMARDKPGYAALEWTTYAQHLQAAGVDWRVYQEYDNFGCNSLAYFFRTIAICTPTTNVTSVPVHAFPVPLLKMPSSPRPSIWLPQSLPMCRPIVCRKYRGSFRPPHIANIRKHRLRMASRWWRV